MQRRRNSQQASELAHPTRVYVLRRLYAEIAYDGNFRHLSALLSLCHYVKHVHVHLVHGCSRHAIRRCRDIIEKLGDLESFTFTSELPSCRPLELPYDFVKCAAVCGNVTYQKSTDTWTCVRIHDLECCEPSNLPYQLVVAVVYSKEGPASEWVRMAKLEHIWAKVRQLCIMPFPEHALKFSDTKAEIKYLESLCLFFGTALSNVVELNINSLHFDPNLDFAKVLQDESLENLLALSVAPCSLRRPSSLRRLAQICPNLADLDVRFDRKGRILECTGCKAEFIFEPEDTVGKREGTTKALFPNGLARLTLSDVPVSACLWFIESCSPTATVRLCEFPSSSSPEYARWCLALANTSTPSCVILRHERIEEIILMAQRSPFLRLEHLYILSSACLPEDVANRFVHALHKSLPRLQYLHIHYKKRLADAIDERITWMRGSRSERGGDALVRNGPCIQSCSTATFIGLAKPLNRNVQPTL
ncbi:hypothetical protein MTO96_052117 [Rhipicephalus appendiculatus]